MIEEYDIVVVGAGHAGCEAALAAARMGRRTCLLTTNIELIAQMSCNPAIGGLAKGQLVREIDALGGAMGGITDATGIQFRVLNTRRGPAVRSPRAQADRELYKTVMRGVVLAQERLVVREDTALEVLTDGGRVTGLLGRSGVRYAARAVILTTGTFLRGLIHIGENMFPGGRAGEPASGELSCSLEALGLQLGRLKTGTPPRVNGRSIDLEALERHDGDEHPRAFSFATDPEILARREQMPCYLTATNTDTHRIISDNLDRAPLFSGQITGAGPRYCPSIEDKVHRFPDRESHQIFLEPEGRETPELYCNGIPTSLPSDVQEAMVRTIRGMERAEITRFGYAVEYDFVPPTQLHPSLETKAIGGLFLAGQINGTSGYEEAAAQGIMAGINATLILRGEEPIVLGRDQAYIGVLIDDLVTKGTEEPYRMFTSRAEYRLVLRHDNADRRLMACGHRLGLVSDEQFDRLRCKERAIGEMLEFLRTHRHEGRSLEELLRRPEVAIGDVLALCRPAGVGASEPVEIHADVLEQVEIEVKYAGYIARQGEQVERFGKLEGKPIPAGFDFGEIREMRREAREKLARIRPRSIGQASRISGVSSADISLLLVHLHRGRAGRGRRPATRDQ